MSLTRTQKNWIVVVAAQVSYIQTTNQRIANFASNEDLYSLSFQLFWVRKRHKGGQYHCKNFTFLGKKKKNILCVFFPPILFFCKRQIGNLEMHLMKPTFGGSLNI